MTILDEQGRPKVGVGVVVFRGDEIILMLRQGAHGEGSWCPPGGHLEYGESWEDCAKREALEELGVEIENVQFLGVTNDIHEKERKHYITIILRADLVGGEPRIMEPEKMSALRWVTWDTLPSPMFLPMQNLLKSQFSPRGRTNC